MADNNRTVRVPGEGQDEESLEEKYARQARREEERTREKKRIERFGK